MLNYKKICKPYQREIIASLKKWININSIFDESTVSKEMPFGQGVHDALEYIALLGEEKGFKVDRCDGYCTEISYGEGDIIGIFAHCDVVPVSGEWKYPPFSGEIDDNKMYGRGTSDDKGPAIAAFYALCALKDNNLLSSYQVKLVIGGNEESGSKCLDYYFNILKKSYPKYGFTPDGEFPLIYGEKGIANYQVEQDVQFANIKQIHAGVVANSVIDKAEAIIEAPYNIVSFAKTYFAATLCNYELSDLNDGTFKLTIYGKAAHGSLPKNGVNAALCLLRFLSIYYQDEEEDIVPYFYFDCDGHALKSFYKSKLLHETTYNVGLLNYENHKLSYVVNFRYPENVNVDEVLSRLNSLNIGRHTLLSKSDPLLINPKSKMVKTLLKVYQDETGDLNTKIMTIGGGTYAKECKNTLAFGSHFPGREDRIHNNNETITLDDLLSSISIYAHAINELGRL